jgi:hypothetical protein
MPSSAAPQGFDIALVLNPCQSTKVLVDALNQHLLRTHAAGRRTIVIIDEARDPEIWTKQPCRSTSRAPPPQTL